MSTILTKLLNDINVNKQNVFRLEESPEDSSIYPLYVILKCLNGLDTILLVNELNIRRNITNLHAHDFLVSVIPKKKRYNPWIKKETSLDIYTH
jgi:hypothetical protein